MILKRGMLSIFQVSILCLYFSSRNVTAGSGLVATFLDRSPGVFNHLVLDSNTNNLYVAGVNKIHQLTDNLDFVQTIVTGPFRVPECMENCNEPNDNVNKALLIDHASNRLINCGSVEGLCSVRDLNNISHILQEGHEPVVARSAQASSVAFIAPGPLNSSKVMYVGATYAKNSPYESIIPAVSSRSLENSQLFLLANVGYGGGTRIYVNSLSRDRYPIDYVYGFSSKGFSYFLTTQLRDFNSNIYYSKLVRVCQNDENYYSYSEIPITCTGENNTNYNLVQAAFKGTPGVLLARDLGISAQDDVLYAIFSVSQANSASTPSDLSALCVYSLKDIRRKFMQNIQACFLGNGSRGLSFITPSTSCLPVRGYAINEDFCGMDVNTPLGGEQPVEAVPVAVFMTRLTAVAALAADEYTVVFAGTSQGHIKNIIINSATSAYEYSDIIIDQDRPIKKDLVFDALKQHLYVMTDVEVSKVKIWDCSMYTSCKSCLEVKDPFCGWCSTRNKCSIKSECPVGAKDPVYWRQRVLPFHSDTCNNITEAATDYTFFDCNIYTTCTECVSTHSCNWCIDSHRCTHNKTENCRNEKVVTDISRLGSKTQSFESCLAIRSTSSTKEISVHSGFKKAISVKVSGNIGQAKLKCQFVIEGRVVEVNADVLVDIVYCGAVEFIYSSAVPNLMVSFSIKRDDKPLDNPDNIYVLIYRCEELAVDCGTCLILQNNFNCGWCHGSNKCNLPDKCNSPSVWLNQTHTCPDPEIRSFTPQSGPLEGGTNITINGINLGRSVSDLYDGITIAGIKCRPIPELYIKTKKIVCTIKESVSETRVGLVAIVIDNYGVLSKDEYSFVNPNIDFIRPDSGPLSGGTILRLKGEYLNAGSKIEVDIDDLPCAVTDFSYDEIVCETSPSKLLRSGTVRVRFDNAVRALSNRTFQYVEDPLVLAVETGPSFSKKQPKGTPSGGSSIKVTGRFQGIQYPQIYVTYGGRSFDTFCNKIDFTQLICESPTIEGDLPDLDPMKPLELEYGFYMDNVQSVLDLSGKTGPFLLYPDPIYEKFNEGTQHLRGDYLTINGQNLDSAWLPDDVEVRIGASLCNVTSLSRHQLTCRPPSRKDLPEGEDSFDVEVRVGRTLTFSIGKLVYTMQN